MMIEPLNLNIILKPIEAKDTTESGLALPDNADKDVPQEGEVVALPNIQTYADGKDGIPLEMIRRLQIGDRVLYGKYNGEDVKVDGEDFKIVDITHIRAKINR